MIVSFASSPDSYFHPFAPAVALPQQFNNLFDYTPHPLCRQVVAEVQAHLATAPFKDEIDEGKMFGVLVVTDAYGHPGYLVAYSGQIAALDSSPNHQAMAWQQYFVPPVFDYLRPGDYFKTQEAQISQLNHDIAQLQRSGKLTILRQRLVQVQQEAQEQIQAYRQTMQKAKAKRQALRLQGVDAEQEQGLLRESQYQRAELRRLKERCRAQLEAPTEALKAEEVLLAQQLLERRQRSDRLQRWLFEHFMLRNGKGQERSIIDIFNRYYAQGHAARLSQLALHGQLLPPAGSGECCEPKLLQYAFVHGWQPRCMAMFWWGRSPKAEIRHHGAYYPACNGKCKPLLSWMLQGIDVEAEKYAGAAEHELHICYADADIIVVSKPAGMLSVPGKGKRPSVKSIVQQRYPDCTGPIMVHRLDMDTSGLLVLARHLSAYISLQRQFLDHSVRKRYIAVLEPSPSSNSIASHPIHGFIRLPLAPDPLDRPRQRVDMEHGRQAITEYRWLSANRIELIPHTGRTHQLRVHCAHVDGLGRPIVGDPLYGHRADRLHLHAYCLELTHPTTGQRLTFTDEPKGI